MGPKAGATVGAAASSLSPPPKLPSPALFMCERSHMMEDSSTRRRDARRDSPPPAATAADAPEASRPVVVRDAGVGRVRCAGDRAMRSVTAAGDAVAVDGPSSLESSSWWASLDSLRRLSAEPVSEGSLD